MNKSALREANERLVLNALRQNQGASRSDLSRITALSPSSVTFIVNRLLQEDLLIEEAADKSTQVGRRPTALRIREDAMMATGVFIGLSGAKICVADLSGNVLRHRAVPWQPNPEVFLDKVHDAIVAVLDRLKPGQNLGVGVSLPGFLDRETGRILAAENLNWFNLEAGRLLRGRLSCPFYFENNAKLSALAEMWFAEPRQKPLRDFVFLNATGGLGAGVIVDGHILQGASSAGAEFGHVILYPDGKRCPCGNIGCWEQYASDLALVELYRELLPGTRRTPEQISAEQIVSCTRAGDPIARRALMETAQKFGLGLVNVVVVLNPEAVIVGDYLAHGWDLMEEIVWNVLRSRLSPYYLNGLRIVPSRHASDSSLLGAAALVYSRYFTSFQQSSVNAAPVRMGC